MIKFQNLSPEPQMGKEISEAIARVIDSGVFLNGNEVHSFERDFALYIGVGNHCITVGNGFDAILLSLMAAGVTGDVLVPANAPLPVWMAVTMAGCNPRPISPNVDTFNITFKELERKVTSKVHAVIVVHLFGCPIDDLEKIISYCKAKGILVIEDCSQAHGAQLMDTRKVGNFGDFSVFSFYPTKNLGAFGDGGAILVRGERMASKLRDMRAFGSGRRKGITSRMDEIQAAILNVKLARLDDLNSIRAAYANFYLSALKEIPSLSLPKYRSGHVWHQFVVKTKHRDKLAEGLEKEGIQTQVHYLRFPLQEVFYDKNDVESSVEYSVVDSLSRLSLSLPIAPHLGWDDVSRVASAVKAVMGRITE